MEMYAVNENLLPIKFHYFLLNGAHAGVIPFIPIYAEQLGVSASAIGIVLAALSCLTFITKTTLGGVVDHFQKLYQVLLFLMILDIAADLGLNFIPKPYQTPLNASANLFCHHGNSYVIDLTETACHFDYTNSTNSCFHSCALCERESVNCLTNNRNETTSEFPLPIVKSAKEVLEECLQVKDRKCTNACFDGSELCKSVLGTNPPLQLGLISLFATLIYIAFGSLVSLADAACYNALGDRPQNFGRQRMWGSIGWGSFALMTGYLNQVFTGSSNIYSYSSGFYMFVLLTTIDLIIIRKLRLKDITLSKNIFKDVGSLLVKPKILLFVLGMFGMGICTGIYRCYLFWYLRTTLGASQLVLGCVSGIQCFLGELPFFFFSGLIIRKLGHINTFTMSFLAYGLRFLIHSLLTNPWWALAVELLQGPCFGTFYSAMTSYSKRISPEGTEATVQGIVSGTFEGIGVATGSLLGGFCISNFGGRQTFYWVGLISFFTGLIHWLVYLIIDRRNSGSDRRCETSDACS